MSIYDDDDGFSDVMDFQQAIHGVGGIGFHGSSYSTDSIIDIPTYSRPLCFTTRDLGLSNNILRIHFQLHR